MRSRVTCGVYLVAISTVLLGCAANHTSTQDAGTSFIALEVRFTNVETGWLNSDVALLSSTCGRINSRIGDKLRGNQDALDEFNSRMKTCNGLSDARSGVERLRKQAAAADGGDAYEEVNHGFEDLRATLDGSIQSFPTSAFSQSNFPPAAASEYLAKNEALASDAGQIAAEAVQCARKASGAAMVLGNSSTHELDKTRASVSDEAYTQASSQLSALRSTTDAPRIIGMVVVILSTVDGAIGSAQGTGTVGGNPVSGPQATLPSAAPATPMPPTEKPLPPSAAADFSENPSRFTVSVCGGVSDSKTGLTWKLGPDQNTTWAQAQTWVSDLALCNGQSWRMPKITELSTLYDPQYSSGIGYYQRGIRYPAHISPLFSPISDGSWGWSDSAQGSTAQSFNFNQGVATRYDKASSLYTTRAFAVLTR